MCHTPSSSPDDELTEREKQYLADLARPDNPVEADDEPTEDFEYTKLIEDLREIIGPPKGLMQILPQTPLPDPVELTDEERREAAQRYINKHFGGPSLTEWQKRIIDQIMTDYNESPEKFERERLNRWTHHGPDEHSPVEHVYNAMIHRDLDGPDPLVEEPGP